MSQYKIFVKDCLNLEGRVKANINCLSFHLVRDMLEKKISTFDLEYIDTNIDIGDMLGLYDQYGHTYFIGVINEIDFDNNQITCDSNISYFDYNWLYDALRTETGSTEQLVKKSIEKTLINANDYLLRQKYKNIDISLLSNQLTYKLPLKDDNYVQSFRDFLFDCYNNFGIICDFKIYFNEQHPTLTIDSSAAQLEPIKIGNNYNAIQNFRIDTDTFENNKLTVYNSEGTVLRGVWYGTQGGITQDDESVLRLKKVNHTIQFSDDDISLVLAQNLKNEMFNHRITFDMLLNNSMYDFFNTFKLGMPFEIYYNGIYYNTLFTGYELVKEMDSDVHEVKIVCGKLRNSLTSKILRYVR